MPTICPNCLRPVRSEARYCSYCGSNLNPGALDEVSAPLPVIQPAIAIEEKPLPQPKPKRDTEKTRRTALMIIVILLILVLIAAFVIHYLPIIGSYIGAVITVLLSGSSTP